jgi:hypothetical protein
MINIWYEVETSFFPDAWENCWLLDGEPQKFASFEDARKEIEEHLKDLEDETENGNLIDYSDDFRIVRKTEEVIFVNEARAA